MSDLASDASTPGAASGGLATGERTGADRSAASMARWIAVAVAGLGALALLYFLWPYQQDDGQRQSIVRGLLIMTLERFDYEWVFCLAVPFIALFLIYYDRENLRQVPVRGTVWGLVPMVVAALLYWFGYKIDFRYLGFASAQLMLAGMILWFFGWSMMRALLFVWLFFAFTWPIIPLEDLLAFPLRVFAAKMSGGFLNLIGIETLRHGTALVSAPDPLMQLGEGTKFTLDVERPCSGIRSLFSLMMVAAFYSYLALTGVWRRLVLFGSAIPFAVLGNFVRIVMLAIGSLLWGQEFAVGSEEDPSAYHLGAGFMVFVVALGGMFILARILEMLPDPIRWRRAAKARPETGGGSDAQQAPAFWRSASCLGLAGVTLALCHITPVALRVSEPGLSLELPIIFQSYGGEELGMTKGEEFAFKSGERDDAELSRMRYTGADGSTITATTIVSGPGRRNLHQPQVCLPGKGWTISNQDTITLTLADGTTKEVSLFSLNIDNVDENGSEYRVYAYYIFWYQGYDVSTPSYQGHLVYTYWDNLFRNLNHRWGMATFFTSLPPVILPDKKDEALHEATKDKLKAFVSEFAPLIVIPPTEEPKNVAP